MRPITQEAIHEAPIEGWDPPRSGQDADDFCRLIESGKVMLLPRTAFAIHDDERRFLSERWAGGAKNISLRPGATMARGARGSSAELAAMGAMMARYAECAQGLVTGLFPRYRAGLVRGNTSYRPVAISAARRSWRSDDRRLHVDAFASNPVHGRRILRVFTNVHPGGEPREWLVGEPFPWFAARFAPRVRPPLPGTGAILAALGITKARRSAYDHFMLGLHDAAKSDLRYQREARATALRFMPGSTWIAFTDQVVHAATAGQYAFEQTFYVAVECLLDRESSPLAVLERLTGRTLA